MKKLLIVIMAAFVLAAPTYAIGPDPAEAQQQFTEELDQNYNAVIERISKEVTDACKDLSTDASTAVEYEICMAGARDASMLYFLMMNDQVHIKIIQQLMQRVEELEKKMIGI